MCRGSLSCCSVLVAVVAVIIVAAGRLWADLGRLPVKDLILEKARESYCKPENFNSTQFFLENGFMLFKDFVPEDERLGMVRYVNSVPEPTRFLCGASDTQPKECMLWEEKMIRLFPKTMKKVSSLFQTWEESGVSSKLKLDQWGGRGLYAKGSEFITINGWPWPWSMFKGSWEFVMGTTMFGVPRAISQLKSFLTMALNLPVHSGFHDWHTDGPSPDGGRYHKIFVMVEKDSKNGTMRDNSNLMLISRKQHRKYFKRMLRNAGTMGPWRSKLYYYTGTIGLYHGLDELACTVVMDPGDITFFMEDVWHRTQDMKTNRYSLIFDIQ